MVKTDKIYSCKTYKFSIYMNKEFLIINLTFRINNERIHREYQMIIGVGIDVVSIERIRRLLNKRGSNFLNRFFSNEEVTYIKNKKDPAPSLAASFAAKEAFLKALGKGIGQGISLKDISVERHTSGKPELKVEHKIVEKQRINNIHLSISHEEDVAIAIVIIEN